MTRSLWAAVAAVAAAVVAETVWVRWQMDEALIVQLQHAERLRRLEAPHDVLDESLDVWESR